MTSDILKAFAPIGVDVLKMNLQKVSATGKTVESVRSEVTETRLLLFARKYVEAIETGRGPRKSSEYGEFDKGLEEYLEAKGLQTKKSKRGIKYFKLGEYWFSAKSLAWKINKEGSKLWKQGHGAIVRDVYSAALLKFVNELRQAVIDDKMKTAVTMVKDSLNGING